MASQIRVCFEFCKGILQTVDDRNLGLIAAGVAFYAMLAIFPAVAAIIAIWGVTADPAVIQDQLILTQRFIPSEGYDILSSQVNALISANDSTLGLTTLVSFGAAIWSARAGVSAIIRGLNAIHGVEQRSGWRRALTAISLTMLLIGVVLVALNSIVIFPIVLAFFPLGASAGLVFDILRWVLVLLAVQLGIGLMYRYGPNMKPARIGWISIGSLWAMCVWAIASVGFSTYLSNFGNYNQIYGSIGAVIALLMWFYISAWVILAGAAINVQVRRNGQLT